MSDFLEEILELVFNLLTSHKYRNVVSIVCKSWFRVERLSRQRVFIGNCYSITPQRLIIRFPKVKALTLKCKPHFAEFNWVPHDWGGFAYPWIEAMDESYPGLEELRLKRMAVSDDILKLLSRSFPNFKSIVLINCEGFTTDGLAPIAANCMDLRELDLHVYEVEHQTGLWLSCFPQTCTSLRLVARCPNLRNLKLNRSVPLEILQRILTLAPHLVDLGIGSYLDELKCETYEKFSNVVLNCKYVRSLSGFLEVAPSFLPAIYSIFSNLAFLNLSDAPGIYGSELRNCLINVSMNFPMLNSLLYCCQHMTNVSLVTVAEKCPSLVSFRLCILGPKKDDYVALNPLDEGFGAIIESCKGLRRLSLSGLLTDLAFTYIGMHGEQLETFSVVFAGDSDNRMLHVLNGCKRLKKLEIRDSQFDDTTFLTNMGKYKTMRFLWMSSSEVTLGGKSLANKMPKLNGEIMNENQKKLDDSQKVAEMYVYRSLAGPRRDAPDFVWTFL
ncbi:hypothetical protein MKX01_037038 [Papaver californicum]|nr:hypothetical protein MKX01_037038 [Papaver californicum]